MILINKNSSNNVSLSLTEKVTLTGNSVYYLFRFTSDDTNNEVLFTAADISTNPYVYNQFNIIETVSGSTNLTGGTINLVPEGFWKYEIYQQTGATNINLSGVTGNYIECGKIKVVGNGYNQVVNQYTGNTTTFTTYNG